MTLTPDYLNATFEFLGSLFILNHCWVLFKAKEVKGVSILSTIFFAFWGVFNLGYYPHLNQVWSFRAGICIMLANFVWIGLLVKYYEKPQNGQTT